MTTVARRSPAAQSDVAAFHALAPEDQERIRRLISKSMSASTQRTYRSHLAGWTKWCDQAGHDWLPATDAAVAAYLSYLAERPKAEGDKLRPSSIRAIRSAIATAHRRGGHLDPTRTELVEATLQGIDREHQAGWVQRARPATGAQVLAMATLDTGKPLADARDAALLLIGLGGFMRRSEIVALDVRDIERRLDGQVVAHIRRSKTDQTGKGAIVPLPIEAVTAVGVWLRMAGITSGPIFRALGKGATKATTRRLSAGTVNTIIKKRAGAVGLDEEHAGRWSGHSLRRGAATQAAAAGVSVHVLKLLGRWLSSESAGRYVDLQEYPEDLSWVLGLKPPADERSDT